MGFILKHSDKQFKNFKEIINILKEKANLEKFYA
jgi:hypothetical protein